MLQTRILPASRVARQVLPQQSRIVKAAARRFQSTEAPIATPIAKPPRKNGFRRLFKYTWRAMYLSAIGGVGFFAYRTTLANIKANCLEAYLARHPPSTQLAPDPLKKTLVVLGSGWGSTSLLKSLNTEDYNVVVVSPRNYFLFTRIAIL